MKLIGITAQPYCLTLKSNFQLNINMYEKILISMRRRNKKMTDGTIPELKMENRKWKMENGKWNELEHVLIDSVHTYIRTYVHTYIRTYVHTGSTSFSKKFSTQIKFEFI